MLLTYSALAIVLAAVANAQLPNIPSCALQCFVTALESDGCASLTDFTCHCKKPTLISSITPCVQAACDAADQATVIQVTEQTCASAGVTLSLAPVTTSAVAASSSSVASSSSAVITTTVASTTTSVISTSSVPASTTSSAPASTTSSSGTTTIVVPTLSAASNTTVVTPTPSPFTGAAAHFTGSPVGFLAFAFGAAYLL